VTDSRIEIAIIIFIIIGISVVVYFSWKGGAANPVGTGGLDARQKTFDHELKGMRSQIDQIEERVEKMEGHYAKASDIKRIEKRQEALATKLDKVIEDVASIREDAAERGALAKATARQLDMIYEVIVEKGMSS
jgi:septation ring formation regulator EzrA